MSKKTATDELRLVARADAVAAKLKLTRSTLSARLFGDGKKLDRLRAGGDLYHRAYLAADVALAEMEKAVGL